ncbi:hypothetical protein BCR42DRAFT_433169 [Absidia repens]|uniref:Uncharacterized protein n=1 Tax=Absidia repens TaxID=90262 RepID=A0A1X2IWS7_9FUNG|nr:hypothetical protein BCR42DRAFT_433169 [Absidia repens]
MQQYTVQKFLAALKQDISQVLFNSNRSQGSITDLQYQAAVPKTHHLQMAASSNTTTAVKLRLRISYVLSDAAQKVDDKAEYGPFPDNAF